MNATAAHDLAPLGVSLAAIVGLLIGSFLNVVIHRVPNGESVVRPRSACPSCGTPISARDNVPLLSWLILRGRCRTCRVPISARYPAVEASTAIVFALVTGWLFHIEQVALVPLFLYLCGIGVALFMIDLDCKRLPDAIVLPSYPVVAVAIALPTIVGGEASSLGRVAANAAIWFAMFAVPWFVTAGRGMGFGDVKLAPLLGASLGLLGWGPSLVGLLAGFMSGAVVGVALMVATDAGRKTKVPYGPFMLAGALFGLLVGQSSFEAYLRIVGLA